MKEQTQHSRNLPIIYESPFIRGEKREQAIEKAVRLIAVGVLCLSLSFVLVTDPAFALWAWQSFRASLPFIASAIAAIYLGIDAGRVVLDAYAPPPQKGWIGVEVEPAEVTRANFATDEEYKRFTTTETETDKETQAEQWDIEYLKEKEKKQNETMKQRAEKLRLELNEQEQ